MLCKWEKLQDGICHIQLFIEWRIFLWSVSTCALAGCHLAFTLQDYVFVLKANLGYFQDESTVSAFPLILISALPIILVTWGWHHLFNNNKLETILGYNNINLWKGGGISPLGVQSWLDLITECLKWNDLELYISQSSIPWKFCATKPTRFV